MKFEPGQKVVCVDNTCVSLYLTKGRVYTVRKYDSRFKVVHLEGDRGSFEFRAFAVERFRLSEVMLLEDML